MSHMCCRYTTAQFVEVLVTGLEAPPNRAESFLSLCRSFNRLFSCCSTSISGGEGRIRTYSPTRNGFTDRRRSPTQPLPQNFTQSRRQGQLLSTGPRALLLILSRSVLTHSNSSVASLLFRPRRYLSSEATLFFVGVHHHVSYISSLKNYVQYFLSVISKFPIIFIVCLDPAVIG